MPDWKASREGIRERERERGREGKEKGKGEVCEFGVGGGGGVLRGMRQKRICMLRLVASPLCVFCGYEVSSTFCFVIISALGIHLPNVANWLLKGVTRIQCSSLTK